MPEHEATNLECDPRFPGGPWTGFFLQYWLPGRHTTNVDLTFSLGNLNGDGQDFVVHGGKTILCIITEWR